MTKDVKRLVRLATGQGWVVGRSRNGHVKFVPPRGRIVFTGGTPSDHRAFKNLVRDLRHQGLVIG